MPSYVYGCGTRDILVFWAAWPRPWATLYDVTYSEAGVDENGWTIKL
jgi:hypothetical protein